MTFIPICKRNKVSLVYSKGGVNIQASNMIWFIMNLDIRDNRFLYQTVSLMRFMTFIYCAVSQFYKISEIIRSFFPQSLYREYIFYFLLFHQHVR